MAFLLTSLIGLMASHVSMEGKISDQSLARMDLKEFKTMSDVDGLSIRGMGRSAGQQIFGGNGSAAGANQANSTQPSIWSHAYGPNNQQQGWSTHPENERMGGPAGSSNHQPVGMGSHSSGGSKGSQPGGSQSTGKSGGSYHHVRGPVQLAHNTAHHGSSHHVSHTCVHPSCHVSVCHIVSSCVTHGGSRR